MVENLSEVVASYAKPTALATTSELHPQQRPLWLVVVNPLRQPPRPKWVWGFYTEEDAEAERQRRQAVEDERVVETNLRRKAANPGRIATGLPELPDVVAFQFHVVARPYGLGGQG